MTNVETLQFHPKHFECMDIRKQEKDSLFTLPDIYERFEDHVKTSVQSATFIIDGRVLFCAGFVRVWDGVGDFWMVPSTYCKQYPLAFYRIVRRYLKVIPQTFKLHRIQTTSYDDQFHEKWMSKLGFKKEGTMRQFNRDKTNMCVYGRLF